MLKIFRSSQQSQVAQDPQETTVDLRGHEIPVLIKRHVRARSIKLRCDSVEQKVILTLPSLASVERGLSFLKKSESWVIKNLNQSQPKRPFEHGARIPLLGQERILIHKQAHRGRVILSEDTIHVECAVASLERVVRRWLVVQAQSFFESCSLNMAKKLGVRLGSVRIRDLRASWGRCSQAGDVSYAWRAIMAPEDVATYLCAHEVSHIREMNHSPQFWAHVEELCPHYRRHRRWLKKEGKDLFLYGA